MQTVIAFGHQKGVGKDTAARAIRRKFNNVLKLSLAYSLKFGTHCMLKSCGLKEPAYYDLYPNQKDVILPKLDVTPRDIWLKYAEINDTIASNWAVNNIIKEIYERGRAYNIISDLRRLRELMCLSQEFHTIYVKVSRPGFDKTDGHRIEMELRNVKPRFTLVNDGTEEDLCTAAVDLFLQIRKERP